MVWMQWDCRFYTGLPLPPPRSRLCWLWSWKEDLQQAWNRDRRAVWDQVGLSHCRHEGLMMVQDEARLRRGHNDQSCWGHQCSETTLTGDSRFHIGTPRGIEPRFFYVMGSILVVHWTGETWCECSEIAGSPQVSICPWRLLACCVKGVIPREIPTFTNVYSRWSPWNSCFSRGLHHTKGWF